MQRFLEGALRGKASEYFSEEIFAPILLHLVWKVLIFHVDARAVNGLIILDKFFLQASIFYFFSRLEIVYTWKRIKSSNLSLSARI